MVFSRFPPFLSFPFPSFLLPSSYIYIYICTSSAYNLSKSTSTYRPTFTKTKSSQVKAKPSQGKVSTKSMVPCSHDSLPSPSPSIHIIHSCRNIDPTVPIQTVLGSKARRWCSGLWLGNRVGGSLLRWIGTEYG